ncbi:MAG: hypothetical protein FJW30_05715, partial [Acidobacteria bacterium]|nr:hypothetical protein [Acidobacteriota bacterium]
MPPTLLQPASLKDLKQSKLYERLEAESALRAQVDAAAKRAKSLLATVCNDMRLFTLHDERHILNIVWWMDWLLQPSLNELEPEDCRMLLLAAYCHDLGMAASAEQLAKMKNGEDPEYSGFLHGKPDLVQERDRARGKLQYSVAEAIEQRLITEHLRRSHADRRSTRMRGHVESILGGEPPAGLIELCISHNQSASWLREQGIPYKGRTDGSHLPFLGLVLRLADILDFDSSRTPEILFKHLGLDGELQKRILDPDGTSQRELRKHLAVERIEFDADDEILSYLAPACPDPVTDHGIRSFIGQIRTEVDHAKEELRRLGRDGAALRLPRVEGVVHPKNNAYVYQDWQFRISQAEILDLLMGTALYGQPELAIRELLQNALDALELRDLRLQYRRQTGAESSINKTDGTPCPEQPGFFRDGATGEPVELKVDLTWGYDEERQRWWLQVADNGVGMSQRTIERYFTTLGKSFYRSEEFEREQSKLREKGLISTPISQFGIGVLSSFMLADSIDVRTHCGSGESTNFHVSGPGTLFWTKAGTRREQGTEIRLWLKPEFQIAHDWERCCERLRKHFGYGDAKWNDDSGLDPGFEAGKSVLWPKYPLTIGGDGQRIDENFHHQV